MIKVLVVDDSAFMRKMISDILERHENIRVIDKARNGQDALDKLDKLDPDVITMDVEMPVMSGIDALKEIMKRNPKPVIMVSSITKEGADTTIQAMEIGAFDFISKPSGSISLDFHKVGNDLIEKVLHASSLPAKKIKELSVVHEKKRPVSLTPVEDGLLYKQKPGIKSGVDTLVVIGTSTGGPKALQEVLARLPKSFPHPILIVQHMPKGFTKSLSERLNSLSEISVKEAEDGEIIKKGIAYIAPGGYHLKVRGVGTSVAIRLDQSELVNGHRPSVDTMFTSQTDIKLKSIIAVVMTGMGSDGKKGLVHLKENMKTIAIAESERTCVVYGMPRAAISTNLVDEVKDVEEIASTIVKYS
ncbi:chemotaxis response regulator protein-glutamate methylesterase [Bacillus sp. A301a_S52]|jgi:two-component system chemotaxis response regulator CheB|nr:chemotaxis response regulator protein-glutamate methylesterase [Bacillus sp. A301a_S52]